MNDKNKSKHKQELDLELEGGKKLAEELVLHLNRMSAGQAIIPVELNGKNYSIIIKQDYETKFKIDYIKELQAIYDSEINFRISCYWDGGWEVAIGDDMNGYRRKRSFGSLDDGINWLIKMIKEMYPESNYSKNFKKKGE